MSRIDKFEDLKAWRKSREVVQEIYKVCNGSNGFKKDFALSNQIQRAAISIMSNIAEGFGRSSDKELANFLNIAKGSICEVQSQLYIALDLGYIDKQKFEELYNFLSEIGKLLTNFRKYLRGSL
ncbi:four helix bundle protein [Patescibacteria group bacterium]|nr:four helix bundle protein [Patescibacteria group bacterium]